MEQPHSMSPGALGHLLGSSAVWRVGECPEGSNRATWSGQAWPLPKWAALATLLSLVFLEFSGLPSSCGLRTCCVP